jgi:hypothetical protein
VNTTASEYPWQTREYISHTINSTITKYTENVTLPGLLNPNTTYGLSNILAYQIVTVFDQMFPSFLGAINSSAQPLLRHQILTTGPMLLRMDFNPWLPPNDLPHHVARLATALTNAVRSSSSETVIGQAFDREIYVQVRWAWITLPLLIVLLTLVFLFATIMKTSKEKEDVGIWKTSAVATLVHGLPEEMQKDIKSSKNTYRAKTRKMKVRFVPGKGWRTSSHFTPR